MDTVVRLALDLYRLLSRNRCSVVAVAVLHSRESTRTQSKLSLRHKLYKKRRMSLQLLMERTFEAEECQWLEFRCSKRSVKPSGLKLCSSSGAWADPLLPHEQPNQKGGSLHNHACRCVRKISYKLRNFKLQFR
jgi:hypothetical protein